MPRSAIRKSGSGMYHVMLRGINRQDLFHDDDDRYKFIDTMMQIVMPMDDSGNLTESYCTIFAWCLMSNHIHILIQEKTEPIGDAKVTICLPRFITHSDMAEGIETLTQRYWEAMLSRMVIVGHCPKELEEVIGYNPVVELGLNETRNYENANLNLNATPNDRKGMGSENGRQILDIIAHIEDYQALVDRNREVALKMGDWKERMKEVMEWLVKVG